MSGFLIENLLKEDNSKSSYHRRGLGIRQHKKKNLLMDHRDWLIEAAKRHKPLLLEYRGIHNSKSPLSFDDDQTPSPVCNVTYRFQPKQLPQHHVYTEEDYVTLLRRHHREEHKTIRGAKISAMCEKDLSCQCEVCVCMICYEVYSGWKQRLSPSTTSPSPTSAGDNLLTHTASQQYHQHYQHNTHPQQKNATTHSQHFQPRGMLEI